MRINTTDETMLTHDEAWLIITAIHSHGFIRDVVALREEFTDRSKAAHSHNHHEIRLTDLIAKLEPHMTSETTAIDFIERMGVY